VGLIAARWPILLRYNGDEASAVVSPAD
jgi:hypothetical protein